MKLVREKKYVRSWVTLVQFWNMMNIFLSNVTGQVPKTVMSGKTFNISQFCEFKWIEWVMFQDEIAASPDNQFKPGT